MKLRRIALGIVMACAMALSMVAAQGASAAGSTIFTCVKGPTPQFTNAHCSSELGGTKEYEHVAVAANTTTELTGTGGAQVLKSTLLEGLIEVELTATGVHVIEGTIVNNASGSMDASGLVKLDYTNVTDNQGCGVSGNAVVTRTLKFTTHANGDVTLEPNLGTKFAVIDTANCGNLAVEGNITAHTHGSTLFTTEADHGLTLGGEPMTLEGELALEAGEEEGGVKVHHPIAITSTASVEAGSTAFTCLKGGTQFTTAHCSSESGGTREYGHVAVAPSTTTELTGTGGEQVMNSTIIGGLIEVELTATGVHVIEGTIVNNASTPMSASGTVKLDYTNVEDNIGCGIENKTLKSETLKFTTHANGDVTFAPSAGAVFAVVETEHCGNLPVEGTITAQTSGSTLRTTEADTGLELGEEPATLEGELALEAGEEVGGVKVHHPIAITRTEGEGEGGGGEEGCL